MKGLFATHHLDAEDAHRSRRPDDSPRPSELEDRATAGDRAGPVDDVTEHLGPDGSLAALLLVGTPHEVLARIVPSDPLGLCNLCARRLRERALFLDPPSVVRRTFACVARGAVGWRGRPRLERWLADRVDEALDDLLEEEADRLLIDGATTALGEGEPRRSPRPRSETFLALARPLGLEPERLAHACARFHALPEPVREAFFELVVDAGGPEAHAHGASVHGERGDLRSPSLQRAREALEVLRHPPAPHPLPPLAP